ncbi:c-type cytochrome [Cocleimonas sp. KMM 6892]|uniref:di-heme oxidoreductase family protein n=1 Tax=unclassified Cocleimonas TaxID=2639732 RepID=UPI002DB98979|nr:MULTISPECIES: di-heme oxidoredictase family protein [unclassified Cocleimonas]MEB8432737.1 c-type cytochrome [Cocleimonas sp. KMM 6892]MEC4715596.1 c-type cytochrome [Cocleimonas sp. KMM 6895]MEC4744786.1 c-type cytochrome [Cocleimonas sp. KMM 6896]
MKKVILVASLFLMLPNQAETDPALLSNGGNRLSGGETSVFDTSHNAFSLPARNLGILRRDNFFIGNAFFKQPWVSAPASTSARDGLGPLFNINTCQGCHVKDGRGRPPISDGESLISALVRISVPAKTDEQKKEAAKKGVATEPNYGDQLQTNAIHGIKKEGDAHIKYVEIKGQYSDGESYTLIKPTLTLSELNYGELHPDFLFSIRTAPAMVGLGLLEAIKEEDILALADKDDANSDGISGRPNWVWDVKQKKKALGRFGWKSNQPTVEQQSAGAFLGDMGLTSSLFPNQNCSGVQQKCQQAPDGGKPEVTDEILSKVVFYASMLGVPARRDVDNNKVKLGQKLFTDTGCASCHTSQFTTGNSEKFPELSGQKIHPYTDLLLHDMGEGLSDNRTDFEAAGNEWRTPPLWGIGLVETVNKHTRFLHDGRARNLTEAILWHGGEAKQSKEKFAALAKQEREAVIAFLKSL